jgi:tetratricopeptide (TPR) repeat protein
MVRPVLPTFILAISIYALTGCAGMSGRSDVQTAFQQGIALFNQGQYQEAIPHFTNATQLDPEFDRAYLYLGRSYLNLGRWQDALAPLRTALRLAPEQTKQEILSLLIDALMGAATHQVKQGNLQGAVPLFKEVLKLQPQFAPATRQLVTTLLSLGSQLLSQGKAGEALDAYLETTRLAPDNLDAYLGLARAFWQQGDWSKALSAVRSALRLSPTSLDALSLLQQLQQR